ncbi:rab GTPase-activating protein 1-like isoform X2 [Atheta coriaria]|uniref:rab GTPase-activating protein 1-like isoform X2 n=1 Tax=Dalotia coriaria TaxID=877792 RepID=UPI0031F4739E
MEDSLSVKSNESVATSDEFDFVYDKWEKDKTCGDQASAVASRTPTTPTLAVTGGDVSSLAHAMTEVLRENDDAGECKVGQSMFYISQGLTPTEKQDAMKPDYEFEEEDEVSDVDQDCTIFNGIKYLGAANIIAPKCDDEIQRNIAILNEQSAENGIKVSVSVPSSSQGLVVLYDASTNSVIARYEIHRILYFCAGVIKTAEASCFAFTWSHGDTLEATIFQCHVFRCDIAEAVPRVSGCFVKAFERAVAATRSMTSSIISSTDNMSASCTTLSEARHVMYVFEVNLEIKEDDGRGYATVAKDRSGFRLRCNLDKQICLNIKQVSDEGQILHIERCFGVLLAPGRHLRSSDMQLLEMIETSVPSGNKNTCAVSACWDASEDAFAALNVESPKDGRQYMTIAIDLVIRGIQEPVRFHIETPVKICNQNDRFWLFQKRGLVQQFFLNLKETINENADVIYEVVGMETSGELDRNRLNLTLNLSGLINSPSITSLDTMTPKDEYLSDGDEPLLSGTGLVSKDCPDDVLGLWGDVLNKWNTTNQRPKQLSSLVKLGIPEALRGKVWQRLAGTDENTQMMETYRILITKDSSCETVIQRDIARTFPAHDFFKQVGGLGQDSLYRVSKAYAVYDVEVGYCQGLSFLAATLLLHMPEEEAFCVLVKLMYDYGLRDLYKDGFDNLYLRLYQLNKLMEEQVPQLYRHFTEHNIETHMFASQWFLTLFTARFPLFFVFHIIDVFLLQGVDTLFQVALALLMMSKKDLVSLDFEGILKYFRVSLPKKIRTEQFAKELIKYACALKVKKLKKYEAEFIALKEADSMETQASEVEQLRLVVTRQDDERKMMLDEICQLKEMFKREVEQAESVQRENAASIADYKLIRHRLDSQLSAVTAELDLLKSQVSKCDACAKYINGKCMSEEGDGDNVPTERVRELEFQLARAKLAQVEAECKNQDLTHQLRSTENELNSSKRTWGPWLSKTLTSIKEVANKKDFAGFPQPTFISHVNPTPTRRDSAPHSLDSRYQPGLLKDSASCSSLKTHN